MVGVKIREWVLRSQQQSQSKIQQITNEMALEAKVKE